MGVSCLAEDVCVLVVPGIELVCFQELFWIGDGGSADSSGCFGCCCAVLPSVKDCLVSQSCLSGGMQGEGRELARTAAKGVLPTTKHHVQYKRGAGGWEGLDTEGEQAGHQSALGSSCIGHHWFLWSFFLDFFITIIITISSSIFYFVSVIKLFLAQTMHFLLFSQFSSPSQRGRGSEWLCGWG